MITEQKHFVAIDATCDAKSTYNFILGSTTKKGHLLKLSFANAGKDLVADTPVADPENPDNKINVIGAFDYCGWEGAPTDPLQLNFRVSPGNKATLQEGLTSLTGGSEVDVEYVIYDYDYKTKKFFKHFHTDGKTLKCVITKGTQVRPADSSTGDVPQPVNFKVPMSLTGKSEGEEQEVHIAYTANSPFTRRFGISNVGGG